MAEKTVVVKRGSRKVGRDKTKCAAYKSANRCAHNKLPKVLRSCGRKFAETWAYANNVIGPFRKLTAKLDAKGVAA